MGGGGGVSSDYVDLGLPSKLLWAKKNLGAETEEDAGLFFQWGDTVGYTAEQVGVDNLFNFDTYKFSIDGSSSNFSKYNGTDGKTVLDLEDDAAHVLMGGNWRMPTQDDFHELINNTDLYLVTESGEEIHGNVISFKPTSSVSISFEWEQSVSGTIKGMKFYKKDDKQTYLFVPCGGIAAEGSLDDVSANGNLWCSLRFPNPVQNAFYFAFYVSSGRVGNRNRCYGFPVRGVSTK